MPSISDAAIQAEDQSCCARIGRAATPIPEFNARVRQANRRSVLRTCERARAIYRLRNPATPEPDNPHFRRRAARSILSLEALAMWLSTKGRG